MPHSTRGLIRKVIFIYLLFFLKIEAFKLMVSPSLWSTKTSPLPSVKLSAYEFVWGGATYRIHDSEWKKTPVIQKTG